MPISEIKRKGFECSRCGYKWIPKNINKKPICCPNKKCSSPYWDKLKKQGKKK